MTIKINKVIKVLISADVALVGGLGFIAPIFAIFLTSRIQGGSIEIVGYAAAIYLIVKSLVVVPFAKYLDRNHGEKDDLWFVIIGSFLAVLVIIGYIFAYLPWHIYGLQVIYALGMGMNIPGYTAMFTRHIDKGHEAFDWSVRSAFIGIGGGIAGALGGIIANRFGFNLLFIGIAFFIFISALLPLLIMRQISSQDKKASRVPIIRDVQ